MTRRPVQGRAAPDRAPAGGPLGEPALFSGGVLRNQRVAAGLYELLLAVPDAGDPPRPGQFVSLVLESGVAQPEFEGLEGPLLRRPFSVAGFVQARGRRRLKLLYASVGRITRRMAALVPGANIGLLGPLGTPFPLEVPEPILLVGGGRGIAPLLYLGETLACRGRAFALVYGARRGAEMLPAGQLPGGSIWLATEDGARGRRGTVLDVLDGLRLEAPTVMACGPHGMLASVAGWSAARGAACWVSVEAVFGCGTGLCGGCAIPAAGKPPDFLWACRQGPVLPAESVDWERWNASDL
ncbi:MAG: hypothetical protein KAY32_01320 [Candidatus Eisenbacteria sp.]|nr:hypothetical protein [Candidatus Eisenbacteria bacterium]